uniref:Regulatory protein E2 n=1 Tax=Human papillomavirus TaxID=10566 RepID=A0A385PII4_9PAPI|nr:MAG: E2 protein [Human papillomavirus]
METLVARFDVVQDRLLEIYERGSTTIDGQIDHWDLVRQENVLLYYARKNGIGQIGIQKVPPLASSEQKAKHAILMGMVLRSLKASSYGQEPWTLIDTSYELYMTPPQYTFKKGGKTVEVWFDNQVHNAMPYTLWSSIYYQDSNDMWHKTRGHVSVDGLYYIDWEGTHIYYVRFAEQAKHYGQTGEWQVRTDSQIFSTSVASTSLRAVDQRPARSAETTCTRASPCKRPSRRASPRHRRTPSTGTTTTESDSSTDRVRRRGRKGKHRSTRSRWGSGSSPVSPASVGERHRLADKHYTSRLARLQEEARDPPILIIKGSANTTKCWRYRVKQNHRSLFHCISTAFFWVGDTGNDRLGCSRVMVAFKDNKQRQKFLDTVKLPKGTEWSFGNLDSL